MTISYCLVTQTVRLEVTPAELQEMSRDVRDAIREDFLGLVRKLKDEVTEVVKGNGRAGPRAEQIQADLPADCKLSERQMRELGRMEMRK